MRWRAVDFSRTVTKGDQTTKRLIIPLLPVLIGAANTVTQASVTYTFDFTDINSQNLIQPNPKPDFSLTLTYPGFVTTTGLMDIQGGPLPTTLGYSVLRAGTNILGWWGFDSTNLASLTDNGGFVFAGGESFVFEPNSFATEYFTTPGTFEGSVVGNDPTAFSANATLTISETGVPEPGTLSLLSLGLGCIVLKQRGKRARELHSGTSAD